ncbi:MAG: hypothetical protein ACFFCS_18445, partial [Candidatus Hodarchaeota archaeon]
YFWDEELYKNLTYKRIILLFTMMLRYKEEIFQKIEKVVKYMKQGTIKLDIASDEELMLRNPRALKR